MATPLGTYQIEEQIGQGGMARIYRAYHPVLNCWLAVKVLTPECGSDPVLVQRFQQEAQSAAALQHPHIVRIRDASVAASPYYIAMDYLEGGTLADWLAARRFTPSEAVGIVLPLCEALDYAHQHGVIHRDIKPANILFDLQGRPLLTDFGIARVTAKPHLTSVGMVLGTPEYMSPEQAKGFGIDARTDIYSLGIILYEMLTGHVPFSHADPLVTMRQIVHEAPPRLRRQAPQVSPQLEAVIMRALAKHPDERYPSGAAFARALWEAFTPASRPQAPVSQRKWLLLMLIIIIVVIGGVLAAAAGGVFGG